ncbi:LamG domain-containing protein [Xanthomonas vasicola]|uniref:LamG-like jellyroll fold domain-containing protein n=1 Tax=Xanthomonas vasicola TaxID=56459 RepID=UPI000531519F|nr:LamG-like jellyroll fold domain-containing protein [Xanthomonas vasicola]AZR24680.1 LamG domain-containing protein [Xanthomonas vasicola]
MGVLLLIALPVSAAAVDAPELLFRVSADRSLEADVARGDGVPNFRDKIALVPTGKRGNAIEWADDGVLSWNAPGNLYTQRGTLSFFWRSRYPVGEAPFVIFRVGYADHTSWDMAWLRIDWNGHGFDAFVTDANLARTRVSFQLDKNPAASDWTHIAFAWDETRGVRLYVDGKEAARVDCGAPCANSGALDFDAALDQFGLAGRVMSPHQVQSRYNFLRGSDFDEIRIYDRMLDGAGATALARLQDPTTAPAIAADAQYAAFLHRYGWDNGHAPPALTAPVTRIRKVEFADARDLKQWMWKATDGIAETTWPGVYNRSRLPGRNDYFQLPDWNTYVEGGKALDLTLPDEPFNRIELRGAAYGQATYAAPNAQPQPLFARQQGVVRSVDQFEERRGGTLRFANTAQETPIQEIWAYDVQPGGVPKGSAQLSYTVRSDIQPDYDNLVELRAVIAGRYPASERQTVIALPTKGPARKRASDKAAVTDQHPIVHILMPSSLGDCWENMHDGLDGIAITLPALTLPATHNGSIPLNIRIKDPIWPARDMLDVSVAVVPGQARTLWLDLRDRILSNDSLMLSIAAAAPGFDAKALDGTQLQLVFKPRAETISEHVADRFNQVKDNWGFLVEEHTTSKRQLLYKRLDADITDLLRVDPDNALGREYWNDISYANQSELPVEMPTVAKGVPAWAFWQLEDLKATRRYIRWWIDERQVAYGDFGGGISDDSDLVQQWPGVALMGVDPDILNASMLALSEANYRNGMFTNGLSTIETDELHSYEEGININSALLYLNWGDPRTVERLMETVKAFDTIIQVNPQGHLLFASNWFGGRKVYRQPNWQWQKPYSFPIVHPAILLGGYNADSNSRRIVTGLADGYLAHAYTNAKGNWALPNEINWQTGKTRGGELFEGSGGADTLHTFWAAYRFTGEDRYLKAINYRVANSGPNGLSLLNENFLDVMGKRNDWASKLIDAANKDDGSAPDFPHFVAWEQTGNLDYLASIYHSEAREKLQNFYMHTEGHWWSDRVESPTVNLQRARLGGVALKRNQTYPGHTVSWRFADPEAATQVAIAIPAPQQDRFTVIAYNTSSKPQRASMTGWNVAPGQWRITQGVDRDGDGKIDSTGTTREVAFEKSASLDIDFPASRTTILQLERIAATTPVELRPDLGIGHGDVRVTADAIEVTVHSLGHADAPAGFVVLEDARGEELARAGFPALAAPRDLTPRTAVVRVAVPSASTGKDARLRLVTEGEVAEVTQRNNTLAVPKK